MLVVVAVAMSFIGVGIAKLWARNRRFEYFYNRRYVALPVGKLDGAFMIRKGVLEEPDHDVSALLFFLESSQNG